MSEPIRITIAYDERNQLVIRRAISNLTALQRAAGGFNGTNQSLRAVEAEATRVAAALNNRFTGAIRVAESGMWSLTRTAERVGRTLSFAFVGGVIASTFALRSLAKAFVDINEQFAGFEITLKSSFQSLKIARDLRNEVVKITAQSPIPFSDIADAVRSFSVLPFPRAQLSQQASRGTYDDPQGFLRRSIRLVEQMLAFRPDKTEQDAIFAIREALGGEFRSLIRRFDLPGSYISATAGKSLKELRNDPEATFETLKSMFSKIITPEAISEFTKQPRIFFQNLREQIFTRPLLAIGDTGFYQDMINYFDQVFRQVTAFIDTNLKPYAERIGNSLRKTFGGLLEVSTEFVDELMHMAGAGEKDMPGFSFLHRFATVLERAFRSAQQVLPELTKNVLDFFRTLTPAILKLGEIAAKVAKFFASSFVDSPISTIAMFSLITGMFRSLPTLLTEGLKKVSAASTATFSSGMALGRARATGMAGNAGAAGPGTGGVAMGAFGAGSGSSFYTQSAFWGLRRWQGFGPAQVSPLAGPSGRPLANFLIPPTRGGMPFRLDAAAMAAAGGLTPQEQRAIYSNILARTVNQAAARTYWNNRDAVMFPMLAPSWRTGIGQTNPFNVNVNETLRRDARGRVTWTSAEAARNLRLNNPQGYQWLATPGGRVSQAVGRQAMEAAEIAGQRAGVGGAIGSFVGGITRFVGGIALFMGAVAVISAAVKWFQDMQEKERDDNREEFVVSMTKALDRIESISQNGMLSGSVARSLQAAHDRRKRDIRSGLVAPTEELQFSEPFNFTNVFTPRQKITGYTQPLQGNPYGLPSIGATATYTPEGVTQFTNIKTPQGMAALMRQVDQEVSSLARWVEEIKVQKKGSSEWTSPLDSTMKILFDAEASDEARQAVIASGENRLKEVAAFYDRLHKAIPEMARQIPGLKLDQVSPDTEQLLAEIQQKAEKFESPRTIVEKFYENSLAPIYKAMSAIPNSDGFAWIRQLNEYQDKQDDTFTPFAEYARAMTNVQDSFKILNEVQDRLGRLTQIPATSPLDRTLAKMSQLDMAPGWGYPEGNRGPVFDRESAAAISALDEIITQLESPTGADGWGFTAPDKTVPFEGKELKYAEYIAALRAKRQDLVSFRDTGQSDFFNSVFTDTVREVSRSMGDQNAAWITMMAKAIDERFSAVQESAPDSEIFKSSLKSWEDFIQKSPLAPQNQKRMVELFSDIPIDTDMLSGEALQAAQVRSAAAIAEIKKSLLEAAKVFPQITEVLEATGLVSRSAMQSVFTWMRTLGKKTWSQSLREAELGNTAFASLSETLDSGGTMNRALVQNFFNRSQQMGAERKGFQIIDSIRNPLSDADLATLNEDSAGPDRIAVRIEKLKILEAAQRNVAEQYASLADKLRSQGLTEPADAAETAFLSATKAAEGFRSTLEEIQGSGFLSSFEEGFLGLTEMWRATAMNMRSVGEELAQSLSQELGGLFDNFITGSKSGSEAFREFGYNLLRTAANTLANKAFQSLIGWGVNALGFGPQFSAVPGPSQNVPKLAGGGMIVGGSGQRDDVPLLGMGGEYMVNKAAVRYYGSAFFDALNTRQVPKFASGGVVGSRVSASPSRGGDAVTVNLTVNEAGGMGGTSAPLDTQELARAIKEATVQEMLNQRRIGGIDRRY